MKSVLIGALHEHFVFGQRMQGLAGTFARTYGIQLDKKFVAKGSVANIVPENGSIAMAFMGLRLKTWVSEGSDITIICDGATIKDRHYQAVGFVRPMFDTDGVSILRWERIVIGCGSTLQQDGQSLFDATMAMLKDMATGYMMCKTGER